MADFYRTITPFHISFNPCKGKPPQNVKNAFCGGFRFYYAVLPLFNAQQHAAVRRQEERKLGIQLAFLGVAAELDEIGVQ